MLPIPLGPVCVETPNQIHGRRKYQVIADEGVKLSVERGKTDQEAAGQVVGVVATDTPTCPVVALRTLTSSRGVPRDRSPRPDRQLPVQRHLRKLGVSAIIANKLPLQITPGRSAGPSTATTINWGL
jgi:hypothetical protein